jgi:hypothetical protein
LKKAFVSVFLIISSFSYAQSPWHVIAVNATGVLINNAEDFHARDNTIVKFPDGSTISAEEAKTIFSLNLIMVDTKQNLFRAKITEFRMSVFDKEGEHTFVSSSEMLTQEMKEQLKKILPGSKLYFEYIKSELPDGNRPQVAALGFTIK